VDFRNIVQMALDEYTDDLRRAVDGLAPAERRFQPTPDSHHIDFVLWHIARVEDNWVQEFGRGVESVWERGGWAARLGLPEQGNGWGYTAEQVAELPQFDLDLLNEYADSVRVGTIEFLDRLSPDDLDRRPDPKRPQNSIGRMLSHVVVEESQHVGQVAYLRGIQRGLDQ
jgi:uncharacterized damage-inducible protein DinB